MLSPERQQEIREQLATVTAMEPADAIKVLRDIVKELIELHGPSAHERAVADLRRPS